MARTVSTLVESRAMAGLLDRPTTLPGAAASGLPPLLSPVEPATGFDTLPHATWNDDWRPVLRRFADAVPAMSKVKLVTCDRLPLQLRMRLAWTRMRTGRGSLHGVYFDTWHVPVDAIRDIGLRREMLAFADAMYHYELPDGDAVILTDMLDGPGGGDAMLQLFGWLRAAIAELSGVPSAAIAAPTGDSGDLVRDEHVGTDVDDNRLPPHSDLWVPSLLFNIFHRVVAGEGYSTLLPMSRLWPIAADCGAPPEVVAGMQQAIVDSGECDYYAILGNLMYDDHPWSDTLEDALFAQSATAWMRPGDGYFIDDRAWLHGRTAVSRAALPAHQRQHRIFRLAYNNERLVAATRQRRLDWSKVDYYPGGCKR